MDDNHYYLLYRANYKSEWDYGGTNMTSARFYADHIAREVSDNGQVMIVELIEEVKDEGM